MRGNDIAPSDDFGQAEVFGYSGRAMENSEEQERRRCEAEKEQIRADHERISSDLRVHPTNLPIKQGYSMFGYPDVRLRPQTHRSHAGVGAPFRVATLLAPDSRRW